MGCCRLKVVLGIGTVIGATSFVAPTAKAEVALDRVETTIHDAEDMDSNKEGKQIMYQWRIRNQEPPANDPADDAIVKVIFGGNVGSVRDVWV